MVAGLFLTACGYHCLPVTDQTITVPVFENRTIYHGQEFEFTQLVHQRIITQTPFRLTDQKEQADFLLSGEIIDYTKPALIEGRNDQVIVSQIAITLKITLTDLKSGKIVHEGCCTETAELISTRGETEISARAEVFEKLARWVAAQLTNKSLTQK